MINSVGRDIAVAATEFYRVHGAHRTLPALRECAVLNNMNALPFSPQPPGTVPSSTRCYEGPKRSLVGVLGGLDSP